MRSYRRRFLILSLCIADSFCGRAASTWLTVERDIGIPMRDGKRLAADVFLPSRPGRYPCILIQTPYNKKYLSAPISGDVTNRSAVGRGSISDTLGLLDRANYAYVVVDWRGFYGSKSAMRGVKRRRWKRGYDGYDCVEWCAAQSWSNGRIGTWGGSALGKQQFDTAAQRPPHLVCCVPLIAAMGQRYEFYYEGCIPLEAHVKRLDSLGYNVSGKVRSSPRPDARVWRWISAITYRPQDIQVPCLLITGWWDNYPDAVIQTFEDIVARGGARARADSRLLVGPWDHVGVGLAKQGDLEFPGAELASARAAKAFFDFHLRDLGNGWDRNPRVRYWQCGEDVWCDAESWTGIRRRDQRLVLSPGRIDPGRGRVGRKTDLRYRYDPKQPTPTLGGANLPPLKHGPTRQNSLLRRKDLLVYRTDRLRRPLELNGKASLTFRFSCDRVDCDFTARLCDERPNGDLILVADAAQRAKFRTGGASLLEPGRTYEIRLDFPSMAYTFGSDHRLTLILGSGNYPRYERNPHTGDDFWNPATALDLNVTVHHGPGTPATLVLPRRARTR
ncbi:MAG: CocE/NonD family hydrolase [Kiritimatiellaeota bacterium]|nr:CocE/NonD family hydrolase [Kiritimatiellota bacterium]